ncbi:tRNA (adenine(37)-N6)-methyltransferase [Anopheles aquasalis]|uniref:tRNA (adenine(37)-N6)-methyltransferase n=1 Tax=Anopheles aquasalis TaxID=42839 RepID=UPI00215B0E5F|nr:tRNA (adenine(37)-N6)-methyltransferase [Anopheles aquasalis]XP_050096002.1 tRNA (adenine(37)-N6)-methyltransferase [Anopheles aquasalis]XP_050096004.1 tRNA (adenine(37)-N6)-methyltransferase [Anopheles aquasalis]
MNGETELEHLKSQLSVARNEIKNLRQQIKNLQHTFSKEHQYALKLLNEFSCKDSERTAEIDKKYLADTENATAGDDDVHFKPIGVIRTVFSEKRAVPRQAILASTVVSRIELSPVIFNNPEHSLEGLENFSHFWIIYYFHRHPNHTKAKVAPPRLGGQRVGVFSTRSPHRPCPIGLSLVQLDRIEDSKVYFYGTDMVNGTPVLDIKPYIPQYDIPVKQVEIEFNNSREAPDGEETSVLTSVPSTSKLGPLANVSIPSWVLQTANLNVEFCPLAATQMQELGITQASIVDVLKGDPRSVYLRTKYGSQAYSFGLGDLTVTCRFDDKKATVTVLQIRNDIESETDPS